MVLLVPNTRKLLAITKHDNETRAKIRELIKAHSQINTLYLIVKTTV